MLVFRTLGIQYAESRLDAVRRDRNELVKLREWVCKKAVESPGREDRSTYNDLLFKIDDALMAL